MKCKTCGKDIKFYNLPSGSKMPVDKERYFYKNAGRGKDRLAMLSGKGVRIISCTICNPDDDEVQGFGFMPHTMTCREYKQKQEQETGRQMSLFETGGEKR